MLLGLEGERVHVDADRGDVGVVLVRLDQVEVVALTHREPVVTVELDERRDDWVVASHALHTRDGVARLQDAPVPPVGEVEGLLSLPGERDRRVAADEGVALDHPDELLARVVEVQLQLVGRGRDGLAARELQHIDQVLVGDLSELAALVRVQVDVVNVQRGGDQVGRGDALLDDRRVGVLGRNVELQVLEGIERQVDAHLVVLERNQRQRQTRVTAEPELQRDVQRVLGRAAADLVGRVGLARRAVVVARRTTVDDQVRQLGHVAHHLGIASLLARLLRELVPDVQPLSIVLVDALAADLELDLLDQVVANPVEPAELGTRAVRGLEHDRRQSRLQVHAVDQVTIALNRDRDLLAEARGTVERVLDGLHGKVRVAAVHDLEKRNLGVTRQVNILRTISYELHKATSSHFSLYP